MKILNQMTMLEEKHLTLNFKFVMYGVHSYNDFVSDHRLVPINLHDPMGSADVNDESTLSDL